MVSMEEYSQKGPKADMRHFKKVLRADLDSRKERIGIYFLLHENTDQEKVIGSIKTLLREENCALTIIDCQEKDGGTYSGKKEDRFLWSKLDHNGNVIIIKDFRVTEEIRPYQLSLLIDNQKRYRPHLISVFVLVPSWEEILKYQNAPHIFDYYKVLDVEF